MNCLTRLGMSDKYWFRTEIEIDTTTTQLDEKVV